MTPWEWIETPAAAAKLKAWGVRPDSLHDVARQAQALIPKMTQYLVTCPATFEGVQLMAWLSGEAPPPRISRALRRHLQRHQAKDIAAPLLLVIAAGADAATEAGRDALPLN